MKEKVAVIILQENMMTGGIESYVYTLIKKIKQDNHPIVWVKKPCAN